MISADSAMFVSIPGTKQHRSEIQIGALGSRIERLDAFVGSAQVLLLCDAHTEQYCLPVLHRVWPMSRRFPLCTVAPGEAAKTIDTCNQIWSRMTELALGRDSLLLVLGGGVLGDMGGFCAATFKRGMRFAFFPTTLLSMVDSSVGGKLGVDFGGFKNQIGCFALPELVWIDPVFLGTLPQEELFSGWAEVLKHAAIGDRRRLRKLELTNNLHSIDWCELIAASVRVKARIVQKDPFEQGLRRLLNFGHTIGHALESYYLTQGKPISHGHAVALGMLAEMRLFGEPSAWSRQLERLICKQYDVEPLNNCTAEQLLPWLVQDKKKAGNAIRIVLPGKRFFSSAEHFWEAPGQSSGWSRVRS